MGGELNFYLPSRLLHVLAAPFVSPAVYSGPLKHCNAQYFVFCCLLEGSWAYLLVLFPDKTNVVGNRSSYKKKQVKKSAVVAMHMQVMALVTFHSLIIW